MLTTASTVLAFEHIKAVLTASEDVQSILAVLRVLSLLLQSGGGLGVRVRPFFQRTLIPINVLLDRLYAQPAPDNSLGTAEAGEGSTEAAPALTGGDSGMVSVMINALTDIMRVMEVAGGKGTAEEIRSFVATHERITDDRSADAHRIDRMLVRAKTGRQGSSAQGVDGSTRLENSKSRDGLTSMLSGTPNASSWNDGHSEEEHEAKDDWMQHQPRPQHRYPGKQQQMRWSTSIKHKEKIEAMRRKVRRKLMQQSASTNTPPHKYGRAGGMSTALPMTPWIPLPHDSIHRKQDQQKKHLTKRSRVLVQQERSLRPLVQRIREFAMARAATRDGPYATPALRKELVRPPSHNHLCIVRLYILRPSSVCTSSPKYSLDCRSVAYLVPTGR
jgi:hypothetical protein